MNVARLLFPAIRWQAATGFAGAGALISDALKLGVGGFIIFGGTADAVLALTRDLQSRSRHPLLIAADLERGAGQQFAGATPLPPLAALGYLDNTDITRYAGALTAREARALGVNWIFAPVADLDLEPANPIVGTRSFGANAGAAAEHVAAWIRGCQDTGALACAKHFPGHGRTTSDSHAELPCVSASAAELETDLVPFRAAIDARVSSMMTAHVAYPALDASGAPATLSHAILTQLGRQRFGFDGLFVTDALNMAGVLADTRDEGVAAVRALAAGCDAILHPEDMHRVAGAIADAIGSTLPQDRVSDALARIERAASRAGRPATNPALGRSEDHEWALDIALRTIHTVRGNPLLPTGPVSVITIDDDVGGPFPPPARDSFLATLRELGVDAHRADPDVGVDSAIIAVYSDIRAWKGRPGLSNRAIENIARVIRPDSVVILFGHPRLADRRLPGDHVVAAWGGEELMQNAAARWLVRHV